MSSWFESKPRSPRTIRFGVDPRTIRFGVDPRTIRFGACHASYGAVAATAPNRMYYIYILQNKDKKLYIGFTTNLKSRLQKHNSGSVKSTKPYRPWKLIFYEAYVSKKDAMRREEYLKTAKGRTTIKTMLAETLKA